MEKIKSEKIVEKELRISMEDDFFQKLEKIKEYYGIKNNTEIIRFMIKSKYREIFEVLEKERD